VGVGVGVRLWAMVLYQALAADGRSMQTFAHGRPRTSVCKLDMAVHPSLRLGVRVNGYIKGSTSERHVSFDIDNELIPAHVDEWDGYDDSSLGEGGSCVECVVLKGAGVRRQRQPQRQGEQQQQQQQQGEGEEEEEGCVRHMVAGSGVSLWRRLKTVSTSDSTAAAAGAAAGGGRERGSTRETDTVIVAPRKGDDGYGPVEQGGAVATAFCALEVAYLESCLAITRVRKLERARQSMDEQTAPRSLAAIRKAKAKSAGASAILTDGSEDPESSSADGARLLNRGEALVQAMEGSPLIALVDTDSYTGAVDTDTCTDTGGTAAAAAAAAAASAPARLRVAVMEYRAVWRGVSRRGLAVRPCINMRLDMDSILPMWIHALSDADADAVASDSLVPTRVPRIRTGSVSHFQATLRLSTTGAVLATSPELQRQVHTPSLCSFYSSLTKMAQPVAND
jgi:hypothetical protein